jgi:hypothetical protein
MAAARSATIRYPRVMHHLNLAAVLDDRDRDRPERPFGRVILVPEFIPVLLRQSGLPTFVLIADASTDGGGRAPRAPVPAG